MKIQLNKINILSIVILSFLFVSTFVAAFILGGTFWGDSSIYLIYAKNIAIGDFFSFNPGEFSSGATSPLWAIILSIGFLLGNGILISKIISLIFVLMALFITYRVSEIITKLKIGSAIGVGFLWYFLAFSGIFIYESGLTVCLISILILLNYYFIIKKRERYIWYISVVWMVLPLVRPESIAIIFFDVILFLYMFRKDVKFIYKIIGISILSLIPFLVYYGYSYLVSGIWSSSCVSRHYSLTAIAEYLPYVRFIAFFEFFSYPVVIMGFFIGIYGILKDYNKRCFWLMFLFLTMLISFILIFMFYSPINDPLELQRYIILVIPFIVPFISFGVLKIIKITSNSKISSYLLVSLIIITLVIVPPFTFISTYKQMSDMSLGFDDVTEKNVIGYLNTIAEPNSTIIAYEVQDRFYLRDDIKLLSLDGITDGKIVPFLIKHDISGFLWKYKPRYMIVNKAVYLPTYSNSIIGIAVNNIKTKEGSSIKIDGITFKNIKTRNEPLNAEFWGYTEIYELDYN